MAYEYNPAGYDPDKAGAEWELPTAGENRKVRILKDGTKDSKSKSSGNPQIELKMEVLENQQGAGCHLYQYIVMNNEWTDQNIGSLLASCGMNPTQGMRISASTFIGKVATVRVKHDTYQGKTRAKVAWFVRREDAEADDQGGGGEPATQEQEPERGGGAEPEGGGSADSLPF